MSENAITKLRDEVERVDIRDKDIAPIYKPATINVSKPSDGAACIFLHDIGGSGETYHAAFAPMLEDDNLPHVQWVFPTAPWNSRIRQRAWFAPTRFLHDSSSPPSGDSIENQEEILHSIATIADIIGDLIGKGLPAKRIVIAGFGQGHCIALLTSLISKYSSKFGGVVGLCGYLPIRDRIPALREEQGLPSTFAPVPLLLVGAFANAYLPQLEFNAQVNKLKELGYTDKTLTAATYPEMTYLEASTNPALLFETLEFLEKVVPKLMGRDSPKGKQSSQIHNNEKLQVSRPKIEEINYGEGLQEIGSSSSSSTFQKATPSQGSIGLESWDPSKVVEMLDLVRRLLDQGNYRAAEPLQRRVVELMKNRFGLKREQVLMSMSRLAEILWRLGEYQKAEEMQREILGHCEQVLGLTHPLTISTLNFIGLLLWEQDKYEPAEEALTRAFTVGASVLGFENQLLLSVQNNLALVLGSRKKYAEAETAHRKVLEKREQILGIMDVDTLGSINNLAEMLAGQGKWEEAEELHRTALELRKDLLGPEHPYVLESMLNLAGTFRGREKYEEAEEMRRQILSLREKIGGIEHPQLIGSMIALAETLCEQGKCMEAEKMCLQVLERRQMVLGSEDADILETISNIGKGLLSVGKLDKAEVVLQFVLERRRRTRGPEHLDVLQSMINLGSVFAEGNEYEKSEELSRKTSELCEKLLGPWHRNTITAMRNVADALTLQGKAEQAKEVTQKLDDKETQLWHALESSEHTFGMDSLGTLQIASDLAFILQMRSENGMAGIYYKRVMEGREKILGLEHPDTVQSIERRIEFLKSEDKHDEADVLSQRISASRSKSTENITIPPIKSSSVKAAETKGNDRISLLENQANSILDPSALADDPIRIPKKENSTVSPAFKSLVERSINALWALNFYANDRGFTTYFNIQFLRSYKSLEDVLKGSQLFWFFQLRDSFMKQSHYKKWDPNSLDDYVLLPVAVGFVNKKDCFFVSHYWRTMEHPDPEAVDYQLIREDLRGQDWSYVWLDWTCLPQGQRTEQQNKYFRRMLHQIPTLIRECGFEWQYPPFQPRLWILFEVASHMLMHASYTTTDDIKPFFTDVQRMIHEGVGRVIDERKYRCTNKGDVKLVTGWLELLIQISKLLPDLASRRTLFDGIESPSFGDVSLYDKEVINVDKAMGVIFFKGETYDFTPMYDLAIDYQREHILLDFSTLRKILRTTEEHDLVQNLETDNQTLGWYHPQTLLDLEKVANIFEERRFYKLAERFYREVLANRQKALGLHHEDTLKSVYDVHSLLQGQGRYQDAKVILELINS